MSEPVRAEVSEQVWLASARNRSLVERVIATIGDPNEQWLMGDVLVEAYPHDVPSAMDRGLLWDAVTEAGYSLDYNASIVRYRTAKAFRPDQRVIFLSWSVHQVIAYAYDSDAPEQMAQFLADCRRTGVKPTSTVAREWRGAPTSRPGWAARKGRSGHLVRSERIPDSKPVYEKGGVTILPNVPTDPAVRAEAIANSMIAMSDQLQIAIAECASEATAQTALAQLQRIQQAITDCIEYAQELA